MNKTLSYVIVGGASALIGAVAGYIFCKKRMQNLFDQQLADRINEEITSIRESRKSKTEENQPEVEEERPASQINDEQIKQLIETTLDCDITDFNPYRYALLSAEIQKCFEKGRASVDEIEEAIANVIATFDSPPDDDEECNPDIDEEDLGVSEEPQTVMDTYAEEPPHVIPLSDYRNLPPYFEFLTFHYFEEDDVLLDDGDEIVDDIDGTVGDALVHFDEEEDDGDCVYVINGQMGNAIEIVRLHSSYADWSGWSR